MMVDEELITADAALREVAPILWHVLEVLWNSYPPELRARLNAGLGFPSPAKDRPEDAHHPGR